MNTENNKIIAEFLSTENPYHKGHYICPNGIATEPKDMRFDTDWNWLMEVVEKIESLGHAFNIDGTKCYVLTNDFCNAQNEATKIESVYKVCIEFIKWYNQQK